MTGDLLYINGELLDLANQLGAPVVVPGGGLYRPTLCEEA